MITIEIKDLSKKFKIKQRLIYPVKNFSLDVRKGEILGIVGKNGAGKSTLLRILAGIYKPDGGRVTIRGRVATILGLNFGLDKRLTLRDNVYFSCSLLGMSKREINSKFGRIVEFAELKGFEDVKLYKFSDGMIARLAFSIAIHKDFDILLIDETISVGDVSFMQKCENKIFEFKKAEKTIVYVSHSLDIGLCDRIVWMDKGRIMAIGGREIIKKYWRDSVKDTKVSEEQIRLFKEWVRELERKNGK